MATFLLAAAGLLFAQASGYANPGTCSGTCGNAHDPSIIRRSDGTYFRMSTGGGVQIHTAPSIIGPWTYKCDMLASGSKIDSSGSTDLWAPDVSLVGSTYYVYYSVSSFGTQDSSIGLATSTTMDCSSFTDHGSVGVSSTTGKDYNAIDANLLDDGGTYRLQFGSFWGDIFSVEMKSTPTAPSGTSVGLAYDPSGTHAEEGSFMVKYDDYYYLFYSHGQCCDYDTSKPASGSEYMVKVCRSTSATSGFVDSAGTSCQSGGGTVVLESHGDVYGPGGQSVYYDPQNGWILVYHYVDTTVGYADADKKFGWNKITWSNGWPTV
ncbi:hypothetical protein LTR36_000840 [Oleoguttula mirabilis]|uniref:Arabinan endo-1,5-alpha-L-arabinosidase n=1 Tax=Oleoguttula mirabilis TaxID=1507867 RepID=A0AAV9J3Q9_9PEZI|nr:hypothetical protein LTR36_000840 [Oleoguttula mirabilis]